MCLFKQIHLALGSTCVLRAPEIRAGGDYRVAPAGDLLNLEHKMQIATDTTDWKVQWSDTNSYLFPFSDTTLFRGMVCRKRPAAPRHPGRLASDALIAGSSRAGASPAPRARQDKCGYRNWMGRAESCGALESKDRKAKQNAFPILILSPRGYSALMSHLMQP